MTDIRIWTFLQKLAEIDGSAPLSDAKIESLRSEERMLVIEENDDVVAIGVTASHQQRDGAFHWSIETALDPGLRFAEFEKRLLTSSLALPPVGAPVSVWSHRASLDTALVDSGFTRVRELAHFSVALPLQHPRDALTTRMFNTRDTADVLRLNGSAFSSHREAASLDEPELRRLMTHKGMGSDGFLLVEEDEKIVGFCWTRVHSNGDGEIFRIAVKPEAQGRGLGRSMVLAGFDHLARQSGLSTGTLWVELSNTRAVALYRSIGMTQTYVNREFEKLTDRD
jgi:mycothiol synthase